MRSPAKRRSSLWLGCLLLVITISPGWASAAGEVTGVKLDDDGRQIVITVKGTAGTHLARAIGGPNRLVLDLDDVGIGQVPRTVKAGKGGIHEIRFGTYKGKARMVVDYQNNTVPPFEVKREGDTFIVALGGAASGPVTKGGADAKTSAAIKPAPPSHLAPSFVPATANPGTGRKVELPPVIGSGKEAAAEKEKSIDVSVSSSTKDSSKAKPMQLARAMDLEGPPPPGPGKNQAPPRERKPQPKIAPEPKNADRRADRDRSAPAVSSQGAGGAREVRPPVTPPTPDPRLVVQEITELKFMQVGHNSRLMV
ncbi:MAG: AMIN domain-containing protein, partial [Pseudomonadota bacterium]